MKEEPQKTGSIDWREWKFDSVFNAELVGCCYWEYARESFFIEDTLRRCGEKWRGCEVKDEIKWDDGDPKDRKLIADLQTILKCGFETDYFLAGNTFIAGDTTTPLTSSFPKPWQSLSNEEREFRADIRAKADSNVMPLAMGEWSASARILEKVKKQIDQWHREHPDDSWQSFAARSLSKVPVGSESAWLASLFRPGVLSQGLRVYGHELDSLRLFVLCSDNSVPREETLLVRIAWGRFTNKEIAAHFKKWVEVNRPKEIPKPLQQTSKGHSLKEWRAALRDLGVMRLMKFSTVAGMKTRCPEAADYFENLGWESKHWSAARKRALRNFRKFLPILPEGEKPLHAGTKGGRAKF